MAAILEKILIEAGRIKVVVTRTEIQSDYETVLSLYWKMIIKLWNSSMEPKEQEGRGEDYHRMRSYVTSPL